MRTDKKRVSAKDLALIALFVALIAIGAYITVPLPPVPFTLQSLFVLLAGLCLGGVKGGVCVLIYVFAGILGLPVFAGGGGGFGYVLKPSFGFTIGFFFGAVLAGHIARKERFSGYLRLTLAVALGTAAIYVFGIAYYLVLKAVYLGGEIDLWQIFFSFWLIFIPTDILKAAIVVITAKKVFPLLHFS
ncbi:MAG: biotin transporter BioY [Clostridia bacterium]|nr:biotin transporter BioY [Clostridia bacterium]